MSKMKKEWEEIRKISNNDINWNEFIGMFELAKKTPTEKEIRKLRHWLNAIPKDKIGADILKNIEAKIDKLQDTVDRFDPNLLGSYIKHERETKKITLAALSEMTGISASYINRIEKGERKAPSIQIIERLSRALNTPISAFMSITKEDKKETEVSIPLAQLIYTNAISLTNESPTLSEEKKRVLLDILELLGKIEWKEEKNKELLSLLDLLDKFYK